MVLSSIVKHARENAEGQFVYCTTNNFDRFILTVAARDKCLMERITLLLLIVVPHTSTIPLEDFYPFGEAVGDGYLTGMNQKEGVYYIELVFFGHTNQKVGVSITHSFQHKYICSVYRLRFLIDSNKFSGTSLLTSRGPQSVHSTVFNGDARVVCGRISLYQRSY